MVLTNYVREARARQARWRGQRPRGRWRNRDGRWIPVAHILPVDRANENLWFPISETLKAHFRQHHIAWHEGRSNKYGDRPEPGPSPNLMSSQIACLNFWVGLGHSSLDGLLRAVRLFASDAAKVVPPVDKALVEPEWIGLENYLGERGSRRRGKYATSADLLIAYEDSHGVRHGLLIESKYGESYDGEHLRYSKRGTDRVRIYQRAWSAQGSPIRPSVALADVMYDPFDQLMRLQLLAAAMARARELGFRSVKVGWVAPCANGRLWSTVSAPALRGFTNVIDAWKSQLVEADSLTACAYEELFEAGSAGAGSEEWSVYMRQRYGFGE